MLAFLFLLAAWVVSDSDEAGLSDEVGLSDDPWLQFGEAGLKFLQENIHKEGVIQLESGLQYKVLTKGEGKYHPSIDSKCSCHYNGSLIDGTLFDSSHPKKIPTIFKPNQVIKGWKEALQLMVKGDKWELYVPSELAYGEEGHRSIIPPNAVLIFQIELVKIKGDMIPAVKCDPFTYNGCDEKETKWLTKLAGKFQEKKKLYQDERERLLLMSESRMQANLKEWLTRRISLLTEIIKGDFGKAKEEL